MGCIESKNAVSEINKRLNKLEAHMNLLDDDIYYIEKRLKRRGKKLKSVRASEVDDEYLTDRSNNSNDTTPPETLAAESPKTKSGLYSAR